MDLLKVLIHFQSSLTFNEYFFWPGKMFYNLEKPKARHSAAEKKNQSFEKTHFLQVAQDFGLGCLSSTLIMPFLVFFNFS